MYAFAADALVCLHLTCTMMEPFEAEMAAIAHYVRIRPVYGFQYLPNGLLKSMPPTAQTYCGYYLLSADAFCIT